MSVGSAPALVTQDRAVVAVGGRARLRAAGAVTAIAAVAFGVRAWRLDALGFNSDEVVYAGQAASLAGNPVYVDLFPVFRAHPMLVQSVLSPFYRAGEVDTAGRWVVAAFGVMTVVAVYFLGTRLYGRWVGAVAASIVAVMPYHVVVTRQVLLDGPMVLFATWTLYCLVRFVEAQRLPWFLAAGGMFGLTMLAKESSAVLAIGVYAFLALTPLIRRALVGPLIALVAAFAIFAAHPVSQALAGHTSTGRGYLVWQLFRRPNHSMDFYLTTVPLAVGPLVLVAVAGGLWWLRHKRSWRETLLFTWMAGPIAFFQVWPVKGFQYLLPIVAPLAVLAARALLALPVPPRTAAWKTLIRGLVITFVVVTLVVPTWGAVNATGAATFLAGSGGVPGGRETGRWLAANTPKGATIMTLGPSMANIIEYYSQRKAYGLSVSPNPLHRNPAYEPLPNPDRWLRKSELQYIVWDRFSAERSTYFAKRLLTFIRRYHGRAIHTESVTGSAGAPVPVIIVYEVRP